MWKGWLLISRQWLGMSCEGLVNGEARDWKGGLRTLKGQFRNMIVKGYATNGMFGGSVGEA